MKRPETQEEVVQHFVTSRIEIIREFIVKFSQEVKAIARLTGNTYVLNYNYPFNFVYVSNDPQVLPGIRSLRKLGWKEDPFWKERRRDVPDRIIVKKELEGNLWTVDMEAKFYLDTDTSGIFISNAGGRIITDTDGEREKLFDDIYDVDQNTTPSDTDRIYNRLLPRLQKIVKKVLSRYKVIR